MSTSSRQSASGLTFRRLIVPVFALFAGAPAASAAVLAFWDFNDASLKVSQGAGALSHSFNASNVNYVGGTTENALPSVGAGKALNVKSDANNSEWLMFAISTAGHDALTMSFSTMGNANGFNNNQLAYSTDGGASFINFGGPYSPPTSFGTPGSLRVYDFSSVLDLNENPNVQIRITLDGATNSGGMNRFDNVQFNARPTPDPDPSSIPEPAALILFGLGSVALRRHSRRA